MKFEIYQDGNILVPNWRWRLRADNGKIIADGSEGYKNLADCLHGVKLVKDAGLFTPVVNAVTGAAYIA